jgi:hypothetical protein
MKLLRSHQYIINEPIKFWRVTNQKKPKQVQNLKDTTMHTID